MDFLIATNNKGKLLEIKRILSPLQIRAVSLKEAGVSADPDETGTTFEENARIKALAGLRVSGMPSIADDSGLEVDALNGAPGVYSARYAGPGASDGDRIDKLLGELNGVGEAGRGARFICVVCCAFPDGRLIEVRGACEGRIALRREGNGGFGYDPVFLERTTGKSFAALSSAEKDRLSHRGRALRAFAGALKTALEAK